MPTECSQDSFDFGTVAGRQVVVGFDGGSITSDAGGLLLGATDKAIGVVGRFAACFSDARKPELIEHSLAADWNGALAQQYGELPPMEAQARQDEARARIERAERWLRDHPEDPQLLATLGRLCMSAELWGKAQNYLEASVSFGDSRGAHLELARLAEREGRTAEAQKQFRRAGEMP